MVLSGIGGGVVAGWPSGRYYFEEFVYWCMHVKHELDIKIGKSQHWMLRYDAG